MADLPKYIQDSEDGEFHAFEPFLLLGLLSNYNQFEFRNPYRTRLEDFVNESTIHNLVQDFGISCANSRNKYVAFQDDLPEGWNLSTTLTYIGLGVLAPVKSITPVPVSDEGKEAITAL